MVKNLTATSRAESPRLNATPPPRRNSPPSSQPRVVKRRGTHADNTQVNEAEAKLLSGIEEGRFVPGQRLIVRELVHRLGYKPAVIQEALRRLESHGVVEIVKYRGATVRFLSRQDIIDIFDVMEAITILIVRNLAERNSTNRSELKSIGRQAHRFHMRSEKSTSVADYMHENAHFWNRLAELVGNPVLQNIRNMVQPLLFRLAMEGLSAVGNHDRWIENHEEIITALLDKDTARAERLALHSVRNVKDAILQLPDGAFE